jgi:hypothetical protein
VETQTLTPQNQSKSEWTPTPDDREFFERRLLAIPQRFRAFRLKTLQPNEVVRLSVERQQQVLNTLRQILSENPNANVALFGPAGTGKSTLMAMLYTEAAKRQTWRRAMGRKNIAANVPAQTLLWLDMGQWSEEMVAYNFGNAKFPPNIPGTYGYVKATPEFIRAEPPFVQPALFLDEFDKVRSNEPTMAVTNALVRAAYDKSARICLTTNLTPEEFTARFSEHIDRRVMDDGNVVKVNLFK